jgi:hypothetical protein
MIVKIIADIYCNSLDAENTAYRLYIDDDLYTERTWIWPRNKNYISECSFAELGSGQHKIRVESCKIPNGFSIKEVLVNDVESLQTFTV